MASTVRIELTHGLLESLSPNLGTLADIEMVAYAGAAPATPE